MVRSVTLRALWAAAVLLLWACAASAASATPTLTARRALRSDLDRAGSGVVVSTAPTGGGGIVDDADTDADGAAATSSVSPAAASAASSGSSSGDLSETLSTGITRALIREVAVDDVVIVTWANHHYRDFAQFWVARLRALNLTNFMVGAMDEELYAYLVSDGVPTWHMGSKGIDSKAVKRDFGWGSKNFHKMGRDKIRLIRDFTHAGVDVLISDIDVAWLRDPIPLFRRYPQADILVSTDQLTSEILLHPARQRPHLSPDGEGLEFHPCHAAMNIGMMWFRGTEGSRAITEAWVRRIEANDDVWDQNAFNDLIREGGACGETPDGTGIALGYGGRVRVGVLPVAQFSNGHTFHVQRTHTEIGLDPYAVHNTFQFGGTPGKRHRMREANAWLGDSAAGYFDAPDGSGDVGRFLSYAPKIPAGVDLNLFRARSYPAARDDTFPAFETSDDPLVALHASLVETQLRQARAAAAIARALDRVLILPPFLCGLDRVWFPHFGRFPGSQFQLPFVCPLDHVVAVENMDASLVREHSFLSHPELPEDVRRSVAVVEVRAAGDGEADGANATWVDFPSDVRVCARGSGTGASAARGEKETCGWAGIAADASVKKRRAKIVVGEDDVADAKNLMAALAGVRTSAVLRLDTVVPFTSDGWRGSGARPEWLAARDDDIRGDAWCCSKKGHRPYQ